MKGGDKQWYEAGLHCHLWALDGCWWGWVLIHGWWVVICVHWVLFVAVGAYLWVVGSCLYVLGTHS